MKIFLVDDNKDFRQSLKLFLEGHLKYIVSGECADGETFIKSQPILSDIILMDINMPELNGLQTTKTSIWNYPELKIIAVSQHTDTIDIKQLISVGFKGFVSKTNLFRDLEVAINTVLKGGYFFPDEIEISI